MKTKIIIGLVVVTIGAGGFFILKNSNQANNGNQTASPSETASAGSTADNSSQNKVNLLTAKEAWEKVKPEADKWSSNYKIARISDIDTPSYQRIDGVSLGWKFYLEECQEYFSGSMSDICKEGKTRSFYYQSDDIVGRDAGISAGAESATTSGRTTFDAANWKIDSDEAQELTREAVGRSRNESEDFEMAVEVTDGTPYWEVVRQCWIKGDRENCDSPNGYSAYVNIRTGQTTSEKP